MSNSKSQIIIDNKITILKALAIVLTVSLFVGMLFSAIMNYAFALVERTPEQALRTIGAITENGTVKIQSHCPNMVDTFVHDPTIDMTEAEFTMHEKIQCEGIDSVTQEFENRMESLMQNLRNDNNE